MPYAVRRSDACPPGRPFALVNTETGRVLGCHATREEAQRQQAAVGRATHESDTKPTGRDTVWMD